MQRDLTDDQSTWVQVMGWCRWATNYNYNQIWLSSKTPCGVTRSQWIKKVILKMCLHFPSFSRHLYGTGNWNSSVKLQNLTSQKNGFLSRQVLHLLSRMQNCIYPKTGQYKTCIVSNTDIAAHLESTKPKPWQSHLTFETVEIFIKNEKVG